MSTGGRATAAVNPTDGFCWAADRDNGRVVRLVIALSFSDAPYDDCSRLATEACAAADIVPSYWDGAYEPTVTATRDQMDVCVAGALEGGNGNVPAGATTATFGDMPTDRSAHKYIEYRRDHGIMQGYEAGCQPDDAVAWGQMAAYAARARGWVQIGDDVTTARPRLGLPASRT